MTGRRSPNKLREPFKPGNEVARVHGATSVRTVGEVKDLFRARLMAAESTPAYLQDLSYAEAIDAYCRALAVVKLLWDWFEAHDIDVAMADITDEQEEENRSYSKGDDEDGGNKRRTTRSTRTRHVSSVLDQLHKHETRAMTLRARLGLDPLSRARLGRDLTAARFDLAKAIAELSEQEQR